MAYGLQLDSWGKVFTLEEVLECGSTNRTQTLVKRMASAAESQRITEGQFQGNDDEYVVGKLQYASLIFWAVNVLYWGRCCDGCGSDGYWLGSVDDLPVLPGTASASHGCRLWQCGPMA